MSEATGSTCPHCGARLEPLDLPEAFFEHAHDLACFNDDCPYYVRGWTWMEQHFGVNTSYRYRIDAQTGRASPLAAWSPRPQRSSALAAGEAPAAREERP